MDFPLDFHICGLDVYSWVAERYMHKYLLNKDECEYIIHAYSLVVLINIIQIYVRFSSPMFVYILKKWYSNWAKEIELNEVYILCYSNFLDQSTCGFNKQTTRHLSIIIYSKNHKTLIKDTDHHQKSDKMYTILNGSRYSGYASESTTNHF